MRLRSLVLVVGVLVVPVAHSSSADAASNRAPRTVPPGTVNVLTNPGVDAGACGSGSGGVAIPGWTVAGDAAVVCWSEGNGYPVASDPGPTDRGVGFLSGGNVAMSSVTQVVDVSASASSIDTSSMSYGLSGWLGGYADQDDTATLSADFLGTGGAVVATRTLPTVTASDRGSATALIKRSLVETVPAGTRQVRITVTFTRAGGTANDGYADSISFGTFAGSTATTTTTTIPPVAYGPNLVVNPGGEGSTCGAGTPGPISGWSGTNTAAAICWGTSGGYPGATTPGPADRGTTFFGGGNSAGSTMVQDIDLRVDAVAIDAGRATFEFSGWLGGYLSQDDGVRATVNLLDETGLPLGIAVLGPVTASERGNATALLSRVMTGPVPPGARTARVELSFTREGTSPSNDGYADSIVYRQNLAPANPDPVVPESGLAVALSASALIILGVVMIMRRRIERLV